MEQATRAPNIPNVSGARPETFDTKTDIRTKSQNDYTPTPILEELVQASKIQPDLKSQREREEAGDAELFASMFQDRVIYDHSAGAWFLWRGHHWERDRLNELRKLVSNRLAAEYARAGADALAKGDKDEFKAFSDRARALLRRRRVESVLWWCQSQESLQLVGDEWDRDPMIIGVNNGVIDLQTGVRRDGNPREYLRAHSPVDWLGIDQPAPNWEKFIHDVFTGDEELVGFVQRLFGYCLTGSTAEHCLPILYGEGRNGKTTLLQALAQVFGEDLSHTTQADMLMNVKRDGAGPQPFVYALRGRHLVWATESQEGQRINAGLIKQLTGGDSITTRTLHEKPVTFKPTYKVMLLTNHKPHISAEDQAMWDRVLLIPFDLRFIDDPKAPNERKRNPRMLELLEAESAGILAWLVRGCLAWQQQGLCPPQMVKVATEEYRQEEDILAEFIADCLTTGPEMSARAKDLYKSYEQWAEDNGLEKSGKLSQITFGKRMKRRFGEPTRDNRSKIYHGVGVASV
jgi:putative DNA primase/helicase